MTREATVRVNNSQKTTTTYANNGMLHTHAHTWLTFLPYTHPTQYEAFDWIYQLALIALNVGCTLFVGDISHIRGISLQSVIALKMKSYVKNVNIGLKNNSINNLNAHLSQGGESALE